MKDEVPNMGCEMGVPNMGCKMMILKKGPVKWGLKWGLWSEIKLYSWGGGQCYDCNLCPTARRDLERNAKIVEIALNLKIIATPQCVYSW